MRSNPTTQWDKSQKNRELVKADQAAKRLALIAGLDQSSKRASKKDKASCQKARAWRFSGTFAVSLAQVRLSRIDWI